MHRWLHTDGPGLQCFACGVAVDVDGEYEDAALRLMPACKPGNDERAHHYVYVGSFGGALVGVDSEYLDCAYGDAVVTPETEGAAVSPCIGG